MRELVEQAMLGNRDAFAVLVNRSLPRLVGAAGLILGGRDAADDAAQDALVRAWRDLPTLRDPDRFDAWLYRILVRACRNQVRRHGRSVESGRVAERASHAHPDHAAAVVERDAMAGALRRLTPEQRTMIVLRYYADLSLAGIADATRLPLGTVQSRLSRAVAALRAILDADARLTVGGHPS